jgi:hypothetical protein
MVPPIWRADSFPMLFQGLFLFSFWTKVSKYRSNRDCNKHPMLNSQKEQLYIFCLVPFRQSWSPFLSLSWFPSGFNFPEVTSIMNLACVFQLIHFSFPTWHVIIEYLKTFACQVLVAHFCNSSCLGGRDQEDCGSKPAQVNKPFTKKGWQSGLRYRPSSSPSTGKMKACCINHLLTFISVNSMFPKSPCWLT